MIELTPWQPEHTEALLGWLAEDEDMLERMGFTDAVDLVGFITQVLISPVNEAVAAVDGDELIGYVAAVNISPDGTAVGHIGTAPAHRGRGAEVMEAGIEYAFTRLVNPYTGQAGLDRLFATIPRTRIGKIIERWDRRFGFKEPEAKILTLTKESWKNGNRTGSSTAEDRTGRRGRGAGSPVG